MPLFLFCYWEVINLINFFLNQEMTSTSFLAPTFFFLVVSLISLFHLSSNKLYSTGQIAVIQANVGYRGIFTTKSNTVYGLWVLEMYVLNLGGFKGRAAGRD